MGANRRVSNKGKKVSTPALLGWASLGMVVMAVITFVLVVVLINVSNADTNFIGELNSSELRRIVAAAVPAAVVVGGGAVGAIGVVRQRTLNATHDLEQERYDLEQQRYDLERERHHLELEQHDGEKVSRLRERYTIAAGQLGHSAVAIRLAGVYSLAALADDWIARNERGEAQVCIDLLCAYLRTPRAAHENTAEGGQTTETEAERGETEVRQTITQVITAHLQDQEEPSSWCGMDFDFTGVRFSGIHSFSDAKFTGRMVSFRHASFDGGFMRFHRTKFAADSVGFEQAKFESGQVNFHGAEFNGGQVGFYDAKFNRDTVSFNRAKFEKGQVGFHDAKFNGGQVNFHDAEFNGGQVNFHYAKFTSGQVDFHDAKFNGGQVDFHDAEFNGGQVSFYDAVFNINVPGRWGPGPPPIYPITPSGIVPRYTRGET